MKTQFEIWWDKQKIEHPLSFLIKEVALSAWNASIAPKWIKITDKEKPNDNESVLVHLSNATVTEAVYFEKYNCYDEPYLGQNNLSTYTTVTHWKKLPKGPKL